MFLAIIEFQYTAVLIRILLNKRLVKPNISTVSIKSTKRENTVFLASSDEPLAITLISISRRDNY